MIGLLNSSDEQSDASIATSRTRAHAQHRVGLGGLGAGISFTSQFRMHLWSSL